MLFCFIFEKKSIRDETELKSEIEDGYEGEDKDHSNIEEVVVEEVTGVDEGRVGTVEFL